MIDDDGTMTQSMTMNNENATTNNEKKPGKNHNDGTENERRLHTFR